MIFLIYILESKTNSSCEPNATNATSALAWVTIGQTLGRLWSAEVQFGMELLFEINDCIIVASNHQLYVTTCIIGGTPEVGWGDLNFLAG